MKNIHILPTDKPSKVAITDTNVLGMYKVEQIAKYGVNQNIYITSDEEIKDCWFINLTNNEIGYIKNNIGIQKNAKKIILTTDQDLIKDGVQATDDEFLEWFVKNPSCEEVDVQLEEIVVGSYDAKGLKKIYDDIYKIIIPKEELSKEELSKDEIDKFFVDMICNSKEEPKQVELLGGIEKGKRYVIVGKPKQETLEEVELAIMFHNTYERLAPSFGYETRVDTKLFETTTSNGMLMIAVCKEIIKWQQERSYSEEYKDAIVEISKTWNTEKVDKITSLEEAKNQLLFVSIFASKVLKEIEQFKKK